MRIMRLTGDEEPPPEGVLGSGLKIGAMVDGSVAEPSADWRAMKRKRELVRDIAMGTGHMQTKERWLPQEPGESDKAYDIRKKRTTLYNGVKRTAQVISGMPFKKPVQINAALPQKIKDWLKNVDYTGRDLHSFARQLFREVWLDGIGFILVDMLAAPRDDDGNVLPERIDQARARGKRPYWVGLTADDVIGWLTEIQGGEQALTQVRIREIHKVRDGAFSEKPVTKIRVLYPGWYEIYRPLTDEEKRRAPQKAEFMLEDAGPVTLDFIPLVPVYTGQTGFMSAEPPLEDLAWLNLKHWQGGSDQAHVLHVARVPWYFGSGWKVKKGEKAFEVGPNRFHFRAEPDAKVTVVEHKGAAIEAGRQDQQDTKEEMAAMSRDLLARRTGDAKATEIAVSTAQQEGDAESIARDYEGALETAIEYMAMFGQVEMPENQEDADNAVSLHTEFGLDRWTGTSMKDLLEARLAGEITRETYWKELQRRGELSDSFDAVAEQKALEKEAEDDLDTFRVEPEIPPNQPPPGQPPPPPAEPPVVASAGA